MKLQKILISFFFLITSLFLINTSYSAINMTISPIKYELDSSTWSTITREAKLTNHTSDTINIITWKSDFVASWEDWAPRFIRKSELVFTQELSDWITIDTPNFIIWPNETKIINFTINIPENATPGWHYWAVFFKNNNSEQSSWTNVWINVDYWVLILLNVDWEINSEIEIWEPRIWWNSGSVKKMDVCNETWGDKSWDYYDWKCLKQENNSNTWEITENTWVKPNGFLEENKEIDNCIIDLTSSKYDKKCINNFDTIIAELTWDIEKIDLNTDNKVEKNNQNNDFEIKIIIPIENKWNTHTKPNGKITLIDEDWKIIKKVWKKIIKNNKGAIIGEKVVDYIPFNDIWGNILPWTKRVYDSSWKWFPHQEINENWEKEMFYWNPSEYYTKQNLNTTGFVYPWQRIESREQNKNITAKFNINYLDENWENVEYNSAKDFDIKYTEDYLAINPYFFIALFLIFIWLILLFWILWFIFWSKKKRCINKNCKKKIVAEAKVCPYCETKQYKEKKKKIEKKKPKIVVPPIVVIKKQKLKTKDLEISNKTKNILIENKLKFASDLEKKSKKDILSIKWIWEVALKQIIKALKKEKMKLKK